MNGVSMGLFASPNRAAVMNSLPPGDRGAGGGMNQTFQNSAQVLSVGIFFSLMIIGLASTLPAHDVGRACKPTASLPPTRTAIGQTPPVSVLFAAFLGYNPIQHLAGAHVLASLPAHTQAVITGRSFFPQLISGPFKRRPARGVHLRDRGLPGGGGGLADARRDLPPRRHEGAACGSSGTDSRRSR